MTSFLHSWESLKTYIEGLEPTTDTMAMRAIRVGQHTRDDFWTDFLRVANQPEVLAELLGVRADQVRTWGNRVQEALKKVEDADLRPDAENPVKVRKKILTTGNLL